LLSKPVQSFASKMKRKKAITHCIHGSKCSECNKRKRLKISLDAKIYGKQIALELVKKNGLALEHACDTLRNDKQVVREAVQENYKALQFIGDNLAQDEEFIVQLATKDEHILEYVNPLLLNDKNFVLKLVTGGNTDTFDFISKELKVDKEVALTLVKHCGAALLCLPCIFDTDKELALEAVRRSGCEIIHVNCELQNDRQVVLEAVKNEGEALALVPCKFQRDREVVLCAIKQSGIALIYADKTLKHDEEMIRIAFEYQKPDKHNTNSLFDIFDADFKQEKRFFFMQLLLNKVRRLGRLGVNYASCLSDVSVLCIK
jgi:hypothetical protein